MCVHVCVCVGERDREVERLTVVMGKHQERELLQSEGDLIVGPTVFSRTVCYVHQGPERRTRRNGRRYGTPRVEQEGREEKVEKRELKEKE